LKGDTILSVEGTCKVIGDSHDVKIIVIKYSLDKHHYISRSVTIERSNIPILIKLLEVANARGQI
jgi:hypothetical protein